VHQVGRTDSELRIQGQRLDWIAFIKLRTICRSDVRAQRAVIRGMHHNNQSRNRTMQEQRHPDKETQQSG
jgi:hypothetical protein